MVAAPQAQRLSQPGGVHAALLQAGSPDAHTLRASIGDAEERRSCIQSGRPSAADVALRNAADLVATVTGAAAREKCVVLAAHSVQSALDPPTQVKLNFCVQTSASAARRTQGRRRPARDWGELSRRRCLTVQSPLHLPSVVHPSHPLPCRR